ncbi:C6 transcription factor, partial [Pseudohyphozyma bogoriensis]
ERKVRCDRAYPVCKRCRKRREVCGWPDIVNVETEAGDDSKSDSEDRIKSLEEKLGSAIPASEDQQTLHQFLVSLLSLDPTKNANWILGSTEMARELTVHLVHASFAACCSRLPAFRLLKRRVEPALKQGDRWNLSDPSCQVSIVVLAALGARSSPHSALLGIPIDSLTSPSSLLHAGERREKACKSLLNLAWEICWREGVLCMSSSGGLGVGLGLRGEQGGDWEGRGEELEEVEVRKRELEALVGLTQVMIFEDSNSSKGRWLIRNAIGIYEELKSGVKAGEERRWQELKDAVGSVLFASDATIASVTHKACIIATPEIPNFTAGGVEYDLRNAEMRLARLIDQLVLLDKQQNLTEKAVVDAIETAIGWVCTAQREYALLTALHLPLPPTATPLPDRIRFLFNSIDCIHRAVQRLQQILVSIQYVPIGVVDAWAVDDFVLLGVRTDTALVDLCFLLDGFYSQLYHASRDKHMVYHLAEQLNLLPHWTTYATQRVGDPGGPTSQEFEVTNEELDWFIKAVELACFYTPNAGTRLKELQAGARRKMTPFPAPVPSNNSGVSSGLAQKDPWNLSSIPNTVYDPFSMVPVPPSGGFSVAPEFPFTIDSVGVPSNRPPDPAEFLQPISDSDMVGAFGKNWMDVSLTEPWKGIGEDDFMEGSSGVKCSRDLPCTRCRELGTQCEYPVFMRRGRKRAITPNELLLERILHDAEEAYSAITGKTVESQPLELLVEPPPPVIRTLPPETITTSHKEEDSDSELTKLDDVFDNPLSMIARLAIGVEPPVPAQRDPHATTELAEVRAEPSAEEFSLTDLHQPISDLDPAMDPINLHLLTFPELSMLVDFYFRYLYPTTFICDPLFYTPQRLREASPFLTTVIAYVSASFCPGASHLLPALERHSTLMADVVYLKGYKSRPIVNAFTLLTRWSPLPEDWRSDRTWTTLGQALRIGTELRLYADLGRERHEREKRPPPPPDAPRKKKHSLYHKNQKTWTLLNIAEVATCVTTARLPLVAGLRQFGAFRSEVPECAPEHPEYNLCALEAFYCLYTKAISQFTGMGTGDKGRRMVDEATRQNFLDGWCEDMRSWRTRWNAAGPQVLLPYHYGRCILFGLTLRLGKPSRHVFEHCRSAAFDAIAVVARSQDPSLIYLSNALVFNLFYCVSFLVRTHQFCNLLRPSDRMAETIELCWNVVALLQDCAAARPCVRSMAGSSSDKLRFLLLSRGWVSPAHQSWAPPQLPVISAPPGGDSVAAPDEAQFPDAAFNIDFSLPEWMQPGAAVW